jgi:predicted enzyme related to lactoylglutathione lyase
MKLTHVRLLTLDVPRLAAFYKRAMGLELTLEISEGFYCELAAGDTVVGIYRKDLMDSVTESTAEPQGDRVVLCFAVVDVDAAFIAAVDGGAEVVTEPHHQEAWFLRVAHLRDPDGNLIELNHSTYSPEDPVT